LIHDPTLLERLSRFRTEVFEGESFRATRKSLDPLAVSTRGGRWAPPGEIAVLYTSLTREGALAEIAFHWGQLTPLPSKPASLHRLRVTAQRALRLIRANLDALGVSTADYLSLNYTQTQKIGAAVAFLGCDGLVVPSARWDCENLVIFAENHNVGESDLQLIASEEVDWLGWARANRLIPVA